MGAYRTRFTPRDPEAMENCQNEQHADGYELVHTTISDTLGLAVMVFRYDSHIESGDDAEPQEEAPAKPKRTRRKSTKAEETA